MSVLKAKRKASQFEVYHYFGKMRKEVVAMLLRDFGYDLDRAEKYLSKSFGGKTYEELTPEEKLRYDKRKEKLQSFVDWFVPDSRQACMDCLREITACIYEANSIYPTCNEELVERRLLQDRAIGKCYRLTQELQLAIETLPVDVDKYTRFAEMIQTEINLLKGWRKSDNKFKRAISEQTAANFANVNNNGNANYNNASNSNGVRPDFDTVNNE